MKYLQMSVFNGSMGMAGGAEGPEGEAGGGRGPRAAQKRGARARPRSVHVGGGLEGAHAHFQRGH